jgi:hypothetical protein
MTRSGSPRVGGVLIGLLLAPLAAALPPSRVGIEFQVNAFTPGHQIRSAVAIENNGDFVVAWISEDHDGSGYGVFARRFASTDTALAAEFQANSYITGDQTKPTIAMDGDGDFVVAWNSPGQDGDLEGVFGRRFNSSGMPLASEFRVNSVTTSTQLDPRVAMDGNGGFVVVWIDYGQDYLGIFGRRFDAAGVAQATEFQVDSSGGLAFASPDIAMTSGGAFVVAWEINVGGEASNDIVARRFAASGTPLAPDFKVNLHTVDRQRKPSVATSTEGFVVAWSSEDQDGSLYGIFARRFNSTGSPLGAELQVNAITSDLQSSPVAMMDGDGDFVIAWASVKGDGFEYGVRVRGFNATTAEEESLANTFIYYSQYRPDASMSPSGRFVVTWQSVDQDGGVATGVFGQRFGSFRMDVDGDGLLMPLTDALLFLRYSFGFRGATLTTGAVAAGCTRCTAEAIEDFLGTVN